MQSEVAYYKSPLDIIEIEATSTAIKSLLFLNSVKGKKVDVGNVKFNSPSFTILKNCINQLDEYFAGKLKSFDLSISQSGTKFQESIWSELVKIPFANTISYLELSKRIGNVKAIRAVGGANGNNKIAIVVPCHRVVGSNGNLIGYAGDIWRKKWLIDHEAKYGLGVQKLF